MIYSSCGLTSPFSPRRPENDHVLRTSFLPYMTLLIMKGLAHKSPSDENAEIEGWFTHVLKQYRKAKSIGRKAKALKRPAASSGGRATAAAASGMSSLLNTSVPKYSIAPQSPDAPEARARLVEELEMSAEDPSSVSPPPSSGREHVPFDVSAGSDGLAGPETPRGTPGKGDGNDSEPGTPGSSTTTPPGGKGGIRRGGSSRSMLGLAIATLFLACTGPLAGARTI